jgi:hypothetical protein
LLNGHLIEKRNAENLQDFVKALFQPEPLLDDGDQHINRYRNPHLCLHRVLGCAVKFFDAQMLLDPFEKLKIVLAPDLAQSFSFLDFSSKYNP